MTAIRFHLDENVHHDIATGLLHRGIDVSTATSAGLIGASDVQHLEFARTHSRVVFTHDEDFLRLHAAGELHDGIVYCHPLSRSTSEVISFLILVHDCLSADEMQRMVEYA